jgi:GDP-L-fucose synthase
MNPNKLKELVKKRVWIAGHNGMVGSALKEKMLLDDEYDVVTISRDDLDLLDQDKVHNFLKNIELDLIIIAAAKVGGILANDTKPAEFIYENIAIASNIIHCAHKNNVQNIIFLGSSCIYPKLADQPIIESSLLTGSLEKTNEWYAIAKIAAIKMCHAYSKQYSRNYIAIQPTNLYGYRDNFDLETSHVLPALIRKTIEAKESYNKDLVIWGSGSPMREFLFVDDLADAIIFLDKNSISHPLINVGSKFEVSILELANIIKEMVGFNGKVVFDATKPDGTPRKKLDTSFLDKHGWSATTQLKDGIIKTIDWYSRNR